ncbi:MAG: hypothetical protein GXY28_04195, partial [Bacteriovoracaceae bacterium]|nr:hypothetical protein [Bacteriovoracaceae bacterium]
MKKKILGIVVLACAILLSGAFPGNAAEKVYKWKLQAWRSPAEPGMAYYVEMFEKTLPAMTNGRLQ